MLELPADSQLMERVKTGDTRAFRQLVEQHLPKAHAIARRMLSSQADAEEAAQDAFSKLWVNAQKFDAAQARFSTWFYRILSNTCLDMLRKRPSPMLDISEMEHTLPDPRARHDQHYEARMESERICRAVQSLPERQRLAVVLCYFEEMTNPEAAAVMDMHVKALEGLLVRARKTLRELLDERHAA
ncbi:MAG: sigma-70 family RNA polymerase sigma factor [Rickettsiales bacterium]|nr:sigma-70 family RNA polymerase sigma factor [Rickettsiales bacterium]